MFVCCSNDVDDVDLMVGGLLEKGQGGTVGETFSCIMGSQFQLLKTGDRYWYERSKQDFSFSKGILYCKETLEKPAGGMKNEQYNDTGNIGLTRHRTKTKQTQTLNTTQKAKI